MIKKIIIGLVFISVLTSCSNNIEINNNSNTLDKVEKLEKNISNLKTVGVDIFKNEIEKNDGILIDLRTSGEVSKGIISGAKQIDFYASDFKNQLNLLDKNKKYLIYCRSGARSGKTLNIMKELGFTNVLNLDGGIGSWSKAGYDFSEFKQK